MLDYEFLYALEGTPYASPPDVWLNVESPVWTTERLLLSPEVIRHQACTNAGLGNLARRSAGLCAIGRMASWWGAYALFGDLYRPGTLYPAGTLLLRAYRGEDDPGHLGILTPRGVLHCVPGRGVVLEPEDDSWELVVRPEDWLTSV